MTRVDFSLRTSEGDRERERERDSQNVQTNELEIEPRIQGYVDVYVDGL